MPATLIPKNTIVQLVGSPALASNQTLLVAQGSDVRIRVVSLVVNCGGGSNTVTFKSDDTAITPAFTFSANGGMVLEKMMEGWFETSGNEALKVTLANATLVGMQIGYVLTL